MPRINCENPKIIYHPNLYGFLLKAYAIQYPDYVYTLRTHDVDDIYINSDKFIRANFPIPSSIDTIDYYIIDSLGECYPVYMEVPCNECIMCRVRKMNSYKQQLEFELLDSELYSDTDNFFVTLTYKTKFLPSHGLDLKDVQDYIKRVRSFVYKNVSPEASRNIKVLYSGEYGTKSTKRPHYHICFLHFPMKSLSDLYGLSHSMNIFSFLWSRHWNNAPFSIPFSEYNVDLYGRLTYSSQMYYDMYVKGIVNVEAIDSSYVGSYVAKYVGKQNGNRLTSKDYFTITHDVCYHENGSVYVLPSMQYIEKYVVRNSPFVRKSINLGFNYVSRNIVPYFNSLSDKKLQNKFEYLNSNGKVKTSHLCSYYIQKIFPSYSRIVSADIRKKQYNCSIMLSEMIRWKYNPKGYSLKSFFDKLSFYINPHYFHFPRPERFSSNECFSNYSKNIKQVIGIKLRDYFNTFLSYMKEIVEYYNDEFLHNLEYSIRRRGAFIANSLSSFPSYDVVRSQAYSTYLKIQRSIIF